MNRQEAEMWDRGVSESHMRDRERANRSTPQELVTVTVSMTPAEYESIRKNAQWDGKTVANYLVDHALGKTRRGC